MPDDRRTRLRQQSDDAIAALRAQVAFPAPPVPRHPPVLLASRVRPRASAGEPRHYPRHYAVLVDADSGRVLYRSATKHAEAEAVRLASTHARRSGLSIANLGEVVSALERRA